MSLREWLFRNNIKISHFAKQIGAARPNLNLVILGRVRCGANLAKRIEVATKGEVTLRELLCPEEYKDSP